MLKWLWLSLSVVILDQLTKHLVNSQLALYDTIPVLPFFNLILLYNEGAAFSLLADAGGWQRWFFLLLSLAISIVLVIWLYRLTSQKKREAIAIALILGGAVGNLIDRAIFGYVIDFIQLYYQSWYWPAFNIADSAICIGAVLLLVDSLFFRPAVTAND